MGFFDRLFGARPGHAGDARLSKAIEQVIEGTDPRLRALGETRERLAPAVSHALEFARGVAVRLPACIDMSPAAWDGTPMLRAMFARPADIARVLADSEDLREFLATPDALGLEAIHCIVASTRLERTVLGAAMEGDMLRQDVVQKTVSFGDYRLVGFSPSEEALRARIGEIVFEGLVIAALSAMVEGRHLQGEKLEARRRLLRARLQLMEKAGGGLDATLDAGMAPHADIAGLRTELAENEAELASLKEGPTGLHGILELLIGSLLEAEAILRPQTISLRLNAMNILVGPEEPEAATIELFEFSTVFKNRPRRAAFLAAFPRGLVAERRMDFGAALRRL